MSPRGNHFEDQESATDRLMDAAHEEGAAVKLLVVDDEELGRHLLERVLKTAGYDCISAANAAEARAVLAREHIDLVLTDMNMPGDSGVDLVAEIKQNHPQTAVIMVTGVDDAGLASLALRMGAYGYVIKPFRPNEILIACANATRRRALELAMRRHSASLERIVAERTEELRGLLTELRSTGNELRLSRAETIQRLALAAEFKDGPTGRHVERMSRYCELIVERMGAPPEQREQTKLASLMHDVGKIGVPDHILSKPGPLDEEEWRIMKTHTEVGHAILKGSASELLLEAATIALTHHERVDGKGYPNGLAGDDIPIEGRVAAVADVFDALTSDRPYRGGFTVEDAREVLIADKSAHFDDEIVDLFLDSWPDVVRIAETNGRSGNPVTG